jgi:hypothetical protein
MKLFGLTAMLAILSMITSTPSLGQAVPPQMKVPSGQSLARAHKMAEQLFENLKNGKSQAIAQWIADEIGYAWDASTKIQKLNDFKAKLDIVGVSPPASSYGKLGGYDLIEESYLPGSDRYFRTTYISYHEGAPLIWEFRFYVNPKGKVTLNYITWNTDNPFEYLATPDMQLERWYKR